MNFVFYKSQSLVYDFCGKTHDFYFFRIFFHAQPGNNFPGITDFFSGIWKEIANSHRVIISVYSYGSSARSKRGNARSRSLCICVHNFFNAAVFHASDIYTGINHFGVLMRNIQHKPVKSLIRDDVSPGQIVNFHRIADNGLTVTGFTEQAVSIFSSFFISIHFCTLQIS